MSIPRPSKIAGLKQYNPTIRVSEDGRSGLEAKSSKNQQIVSPNPGIKSCIDARRAITNSLESIERKKSYGVNKVSDKQQSIAKQATGKANPFIPAFPLKFTPRVGNINTDELLAGSHGTSNDPDNKMTRDRTAMERNVVCTSQMASAEVSEHSKENTFISSTEVERSGPSTASETSFHQFNTEPYVTTPISDHVDSISKNILRSITSPIRRRTHFGQERDRYTALSSGPKWRRRTQIFQPYSTLTSARPSDENAIVRRSTGPRTDFKVKAITSRDSTDTSQQQPLEDRPSTSNTAIHDSKASSSENTAELPPRKDESYDLSMLQHTSITNEPVVRHQPNDFSDVSLQNDYNAESNTNENKGHHKLAEVAKVKFDMSLTGHERSKSSSSQLQPDAPEFVPRESRIPKASFVTEYSTIPSIQENPDTTQRQMIQDYGVARGRSARSDPGITSLKDLQDQWEAQLAGYPAGHTGVLPVLPRMHTFGEPEEGNSVITRQSNGPNWRQRVAELEARRYL